MLDRTWVAIIAIVAVAGIFGYLYMNGYINLSGVTGAVGTVSPSSSNYGDPSTVTLKAYDMASGTKTALAAGTINSTIFQDGATYQDYASFSIGDSSLSVAVGNVVSIYEVDGSYYGENPNGNPVTFTVDKEALSKEILTYAHATESSNLVVCYDSGTVLDTGTTVAGSDYNITLGANQEKEIYCKYTTNQADKTTDFCGIAIRTTNDASDVRVVNSKSDGTWTEVAVPKHLKDSLIYANDSTAGGNYNYTGYEKVYKSDTPIRMNEWDDATVYFTLIAGSTDPTYTATLASLDMFYIQFKDCDTFAAKDGSISYGMADDSDNGADVGIDEPDTSPKGLTSGAAIQAI